MTDHRVNGRNFTDHFRKSDEGLSQPMNVWSFNDTLCLDEIFCGTVAKNTEKEVRCIKYSPIVKPPRTEPSIKNFECESGLWNSTFSTMGQLKALGLDDVKTFTDLSKQPYQHCAPLARTFVAAYGPLVQIEHKEPKEKIRGHKYHAHKKDSTPPCIDKIHLPKIKPPDDPYNWPRHLLTGRNPPEVPYIPKSAIRIHWYKSVTDNVEEICDWLSKRFGPILFTVNEGRRRLIIVYKNIKSSYDTVNAGIPPTLMSVTWCDPKFYNFGHYSIYQNYRLIDDPIWQRGMEDQ